MNAMEHVRGKGRAKNPLDGDDITVELSVRDGRVITIGVNQVRDRYVMIIGNGAQAIPARLLRQSPPDMFAGCHVARDAAVVLHRLFIGRTVDECLDVAAEDLRRAARVPLTADRGCVATVLAAVKTALIDLRMTVLAQDTLERRSPAGA